MSQEALSVATSLYDAALYAETGISERHESETLPEYVDAGMEAVLSEEKESENRKYNRVASLY